MSVENSITSGTVSIEDGIKAKEEFAPARKAKIELSFAIPEGQDGTAFLNGVTKIAQDKLTEVLGGKPAAAKPASTRTPAANKDKTPETPKPAEKTKDDLAREAGVLEEPAASKTTAPADDNLDDILGEAAPAARVISDKELGEIAGKVNAKKKAELGDKWAPSKIRELVAKFTGKKLSDVPKITEVPAEKREAFVAELEKL